MKFANGKISTFLLDKPTKSTDLYFGDEDEIEDLVRDDVPCFKKK